MALPLIGGFQFVQLPQRNLGPVLHRAAAQGMLPHVRRVLADGKARIADVDQDRRTALLCAADGYDSLKTLKWLLAEGRAQITERDNQGYSTLLLAAGCYGHDSFG
jgi:hypothetical protein